MIELVNEGEGDTKFNDEGNLVHNGSCMTIVVPNEVVQYVEFTKKSLSEVEEKEGLNKLGKTSCSKVQFLEI
jgi:hypothetical protein